MMLIPASITALTIGMLVLLCMDTSKDNPIVAQGYNLTSYQVSNASLPIHFADSDVLRLARGIDPARWNSIQIEYSNTRAGDVGSLALVNGCASSDELNYHFVICNAIGDTADGLIQPTFRWKQQRPCIPDKSWTGDRGTVRVCIIGSGDSKSAKQDKSIDNLIKGLEERFEING